MKLTELVKGIERVLFRHITPQSQHPHSSQNEQGRTKENHASRVVVDDSMNEEGESQAVANQESNAGCEVSRLGGTACEIESVEDLVGRLGVLRHCVGSGFGFAWEM